MSIEGNNFTLRLLKERHVVKYNARMSDYAVVFRNLPSDFIETFVNLKQLFESIISVIKQKTEGVDRIKIFINHPSLAYPISFPYIKSVDLTADMIINYISQVIQSNNILSIDNQLTFHISIIYKPSGSGGKKRLEDFILKKQSIVRIKSEGDNLCALKAVVLGKAYADKKKNINSLRDSRNGFQTRKALKLAKVCNIDIGKPCGIDEIKKIQLHLQQYQLIVVDANCLHKIVFSGEEKTKKICLYFHDSHYDLIKSLSSFFSHDNYCFKCFKAYSSKFVKHPCNNVCKKCQNRYCNQNSANFICCEFCGVLCFNNNCLALHKSNVCGKTVKCDICGKFKIYKHVCSGKWCHYCGTEVEIDHKCYILREDERKQREVKFLGYIFFDYEAMHVDLQHIPNLIVASKICVCCLHGERCVSECGEFHWNSNQLFCEWLFNTKHKNYIAIAHNMKGYDGYYIMQYIVDNFTPSDKPPECLMNGSKLLVIKFAGIKIIDSFNFIPIALSKLPKSFGINELKKGFFPHMFNIPENQNYEGGMPSKEYYGFEYMSKDTYVDFIKWYEKQKDEKFNLQKELLEYCKSDVNILRNACLKFRELFMYVTKTNSEDTGVDPFLRCLTIASVCHYVYRRNFMPSKSIALIPPFGYDERDKTSHKAFIWIKYLSTVNNIQIQHGNNGKEKKIGKYQLDGWCEETNTGYEFHGCLFHGCQKCYSPTTYNALKNEPMSETHDRHSKRIDYIKANIRELIEIWECDFDVETKSNSVLQKIIEKEKEIRPPLNPRDALAGGRTNASILHYKGSVGYVDYTSLYPYVQKYGVYPIGHPRIVTENFQEISKYFGLIFCRVLAPRNLLFPVLPYKTKGKLIFPLCSKCAELKQQKCNHNEQDREIEGTWVSLEIEEAIKKGYQVKHIYEIWHWETKEQYNIDNKSGGLFTEYVNTFLRIKQEAGGYPNNITSKEKYIEEYETFEGIKLIENNITENPGLKSIAKLMLNSHWGRYAMQTQKVQCKFVTSPLELHYYFDNKQYDVHDVNFVNDNIAIVYYEDRKEMHWGSSETNVVIAAFVTCQARIKLFSEMDKLGDRVLYYDTDSIIYKKMENTAYEPKTGIFLGEFTNEIEEGREIVEFASAGPKNYTYKLDNGETITKVKGFTLNVGASKKIDFEKIKHFVVSHEENKCETVKQSTIVRKKSDWSLHTKETDKMYRFVYDKRVILPDLTTVPFGFEY